jgi:hypothetical protein
MNIIISQVETHVCFQNTILNSCYMDENSSRTVQIRSMTLKKCKQILNIHLMRADLIS